MTYQELLEEIEKLTPEQRKMDVTVYIRGVDEYYTVDPELPINHNIPPNTNDVLDENHPYLVV